MIEREIFLISKWLDIWNIDTKNNYSDFFDTSKLKYDEIVLILKRLYEDKKERDLVLSFITELGLPNEINFERLINLLELNVNYGNRTETIKCLKKFIKYFFSYVISSEKFKVDYGYKKESITVENYKQINTENAYFRGQSNYNWGIIPSIFRGYNHKNIRNIDGDLYDLDMLFSDYEKAGLIDKYNKTIANNQIVCADDITLDFLAYMQHSIAYSPLIDLTKSPLIGIQFALGNKASVNHFYYEDAVLFKFQILSADENELIVSDLSQIRDKISVNILRKKIVPGTIMKIKNSKGEIIELDFSTASKMIETLTPKFVIIDKVYNDRMRYQHGRFVLFYNYTLVNDKILFQLNENINLTEYIISKNTKEQLYNEINKEYQQYNMDYLMSPYDYFNK